MNIKLIKFLTALCAGLCVIIFCEWLYAIYAQKQLLASIEAGDQQKKLVMKLPSIDLTKQPESSYSDLVARPLFIQGRKPVKEPDQATTAAAAAATATATFNWSLDGVYTYKNGLYALFSRTTTKVPKDNYRKVTKNNDIDGWKLTDIKKEMVIVSQGGKQKEILLRKAKPKTTIISDNQPGVVQPQPNVPGQPLLPGQPPIPGQQPPIPEQLPEPEPVPDTMIEPELIPDESSDPNFENSANEQFQ